MARIIFSAIVDNIRGTIAGTTFQKNAYGYTVKSKPNMIFPNSILQSVRKNQFAITIGSWYALTDAQRSAWRNFALTYPQACKHNPDSNLSGYNLYSKINMFRRMCAIFPLVEPLFSYYPADTISASLCFSGTNLILNYSSLSDNTQFYVMVYISSVWRSSNTYIGTKPRFVTWVLNETQSVDITALYTSVFGRLPVVNTKVAISLLAYGANNGQFFAPVKSIVTVGTCMA